jgi:hypothetical protein
MKYVGWIEVVLSYTSQMIFPDILPTHHHAVSDVMLYDTCQIRKKHLGSKDHSRLRR